MLAQPWIQYLTVLPYYTYEYIYSIPFPCLHTQCLQAGGAVGKVVGGAVGEVVGGAAGEVIGGAAGEVVGGVVGKDVGRTVDGAIGVWL